ncbi:MAG: hypothetical protein ACXAC5_00875 [Promethearchaeota archaeon]|jgi:hypothetical protein
MSKYDLSICIPGIRPSYWERLYTSLLTACSRYSFEIVFIGPYGLPDSLRSQHNVRYIKSFATSVRCAQEAVLSCEGDLIAIPADDGYFFPESFDKAIDLYKTVDEKDIIVLRYREGPGFSGKEFPLKYWTCKAHSALNGLNIPNHYKHAMHPLLSIRYFQEIGGYDCRFEHMAFAGHDFSCRVQRDGSCLHLSLTEVMNADWLLGNSGDHAPIVDSHENHDYPLFRKIQLSPDHNQRIKIDYDNWKNQPAVWPRRWPEGAPE